jgi:para-aminobenzoate synthetase / 4-amino-4-deoxychorismate lyase
VPFDVAFEGDPMQLYLALAASARAPYCGYLEYGGLTLVSLSPELFLQFDGDTLTAKPMKGTAPLEHIDRLQSAKNRAEHVMIVDLLRNDLHRICSGVHVPRLFEAERYPTFATMTSTIGGTLRAGTTLRDVIAATFPCGSVTGAPKLAAMQQIASLETEPRGFYTGSLGYLSPQRRGWWNVAIRTLQFDRGEARFDAGGGIVSESTARDEWHEIFLKSRFLEPAIDGAFAILETLRSDADDVTLASHFERLRRSAEAFGMDVNLRATWERVRDCSPQHIVRVRLYRDRIDVTSEPLIVPEKVHVCVSARRVRAGDPMLRHKTSWRPVYEAAWQEAVSKECFDALLLNERGEFTEGTRTTMFVKIGGVLYTPPIECGLLPGILRAGLVARGEAVERVLYPGDVHRAEAIFVGNSARGLMRAAMR